MNRVISAPVLLTLYLNRIPNPPQFQIQFPVPNAGLVVAPGLAASGFPASIPVPTGWHSD